MGHPAGTFRVRETLSNRLPKPKVWPVADAAWQVRLPLPWDVASVNVFLFRCGDSFLLLDSGVRTDESLLSLEAALHSLGADWPSIDEIRISHFHPDHIGAAAEIRRRSGAPVRMHPLEGELVKPLAGGRMFFAEAAEFLRRNGVPDEHVETMRQQAAKERGHLERLQVDGVLDEQGRVAFDGGTLETVFAPGHSPALLCFYCPEQHVLFSTDAILPKVTPNIGVHWFYQGNPLGDYLQSLKKLETLDVRLVVPSHGRPFKGHRTWIENTRRHHASRCDSILGAMGERTLDAYSIAGEIWGQDRPLLDRRFAMAEALSHLEYMVVAQRVSKVDIRGIAHWSRS